MSSIPPMDRLVQLIFDEHKHLQTRENRPEKQVVPPLVTLTHDYGSGAEVIGRLWRAPCMLSLLATM